MVCIFLERLRLRGLTPALSKDRVRWNERSKELMHKRALRLSLRGD